MPPADSLRSIPLASRAQREREQNFSDALNLAGASVNAHDLDAIAKLPALTSLDLSSCSICCSAPMVALARAAGLQTLRLDDATLERGGRSSSTAAATLGVGVTSKAPLREFSAANAAMVLDGLSDFPWDRSGVQRLSLSGCSPFAAVALQMDRWHSLRSLTAVGADLVDSCLAELHSRCPHLTELDVSENVQLSDVAVHGLRRLSLRILKLQKLPRVTPHALPMLSTFGDIEDLRLDGTSISTVQQEQALTYYQRKREWAARAKLMIQRLSAAQAQAAAVPIKPIQYELSLLHRLRDSPFSRAPPRAMPQIACVLRRNATDGKLAS